MKKFNIAVLLLLLAGMYSLVAQDAKAEDAKTKAAKAKPKTFTVKITPEIEARGTLNFEGTQEKLGNTVDTDVDAEGRIKSEFDYNGIVGGVLELEGDLGSALALEDTPVIGFGENAYGYIHLLEAFGLMDKSVFDIYLKGGRFEAELDNAQEAGTDEWLADVDVLSREQRINMQADFKIMDMLTIRAGVSFAPFDDQTYGNDLGFGVLFEKAFDAHKIIASAAYAVNSTDNVRKYAGDTIVDVTGLGQGPINQLKALGLDVSGSTLNVPATGNNVATTAGYYDDLGFSVAYQGTFGQIVLLPFGNFRLRGVFNRPESFAYENTRAFWSAGVKFSYKDATKSYDMVGVGLDMGGEIKPADANSYDGKGKLTEQSYTGADKTFEGVGLKVWSDALKGLMGETYLSFWAKVRFEIWELANRDSIFKELEIGLEQYVFHKKNANASIFAEMSIENVDSRNDASNIDISLQLGLKVAFTGILTTDFE